MCELRPPRTGCPQSNGRCEPPRAVAAEASDGAGPAGPVVRGVVAPCGVARFGRLAILLRGRGQKRVERIVHLVEGLEDVEDVQDVYANFDIAESLLEAVAS